jgi:hypothetical protein
LNPHLNSHSYCNNFIARGLKGEKIEEILFWMFIALALLLLILRLKSSPSKEAIMGVLAGYMITLWKEFSDFKAEVKEFMGKVKEKLKIK